MLRKRVVLPAPLGPRIATFSPRSTESETPFNTGGPVRVRTTTRSAMFSTATIISPCDAGIDIAVSKHFQLFCHEPKHSVFLIGGTNEALTAENLEDCVVPPFLEPGKGQDEVFTLILTNVLARHPYVIDKRFRNVEHAKLVFIELAFGDHGVVNGFVERARIHSARFNRLGGGRMTAGITKLQVLVNI